MAAEQQRESYLRSIPELTPDFMRQLLIKDYLLFGTDGARSFWVSDNPIALNNTVNDGGGVRGTLGLAVRGIEVYLPISSTLSLGFMCPSIRSGFEALQEMLNQIGGLFSLPAFSYLQAYSTGRPNVLNGENVRFQNSLQVISAERFVFSRDDNFADAADIVGDNPDVRHGRRVTTN